MWKRLILKMGIKNLVLSTLWSQVFSQKNIFWGPYFLDNLMIKSTKEKLHVKKNETFDGVSWSCWTLRNYSAGAILKISDSILNFSQVPLTWSLVPFRDQATVKKMNEEVATTFIVRKMVVGRQSVRCILTKMFPLFHQKIVFGARCRLSKKSAEFSKNTVTK